MQLISGGITVVACKGRTWLGALFYDPPHLYVRSRPDPG
jgi:hypothetical protein